MKFKGALLLLIIGLNFRCSPTETKISDSRPNIVVFLADDMGYGDVKWTNENAVIETPHLDNLARQGAVLTDCYSASSMCSPSRAGLLTSRVPTRIGIHDWIKEIYKKPLSNIHLPKSETTIAELLDANGYQTAIIGKWHLNNGFRTGNNSDPDHHGFNYWFCTPVQSDPSHKNPNNFYENGGPIGQIGTEDQPQFSAGIVANKTIDWIENRDKNSPFFIYVPFHEPHVVCDAPDKLKKKYLDRISLGEIPLIAGTGPDGLGMAEYYASVENMDLAIGRILQELETENLLDNTFIIFSSDNGPDSNRKYKGRLQSVGETGTFRGRKRWLLEGGIRQATVVYWNGVLKPGTKIDAPIGHIDLLPTFCDIAKIKPPGGRIIDGTSILPLFQGKSFDRKGKNLHWHFHAPWGGPQSVMRKDNWVITANWDKKTSGGRFDTTKINIIKTAGLIDFKLYDLNDDPAEENDIKNTHPQLFANLKQQLIEVHNSVKNECPNSNQFQWNSHLQEIVDLNYKAVKE